MKCACKMKGAYVVALCGAHEEASRKIKDDNERLEAAIIAIDEALEIGEGVSPGYYLRQYGFDEHIAIIERVTSRE